MTDSVMQKLTELAEDWDVDLAGYGRGWALTITSRRSGSVHVYRGEDLSRVVASAHAGEPTGAR